jgi:hypothetical protein
VVTRHRHGTVAIVVAVVIAVLLAGIAIALVTRGSGAPKASVAPSTPATVSVTVTTGSPAVSVTAPAAPTVVTSAEMTQILQRYVNAYGSEDLAGLQSLFAGDLVRMNGTDPPEDLTQALETYRSQFAALSNPVYRLRDIFYDPAGASATASYSISSGAGTVGGQITYHFVRQGDYVLIDELDIQPSS